MAKIIRRNPFARPLHPIDKEILRAMAATKIKVTPAQVSKAIGIHPRTAQMRMKALSQKDLIKCTPRGNRNYCQVNIPVLKKRLRKDWFY